MSLWKPRKSDYLNSYCSCGTSNVIQSHRLPLSETFLQNAEITEWPPGLKLGKYLRQYYAFQCSNFPRAFSHCISLPSMLWRVCCWLQCLSLGEGTHRATGVYITATPVKNTLPWKYSHSIQSRAVKNKSHKHKNRNSRWHPALQRLKPWTPEVWPSKCWLLMEFFL